MSDNSGAGDGGNGANPEPKAKIELSELPEEARALAKRYAEQERWSLTETVRHAMDTFVEDPVEGMKKMDEIDPRVIDRIQKKRGFNSREELMASFEKTGPLSEDKVKALFSQLHEETAIRDVKSGIEDKLAELPDSIRELAQTEFRELTEGRVLTKEQIEKAAVKAVTLARVESGSQEKLTKLNFGSQRIKDTPAEAANKGNSLLDTTTDPFWLQFNKQS